MMTVRTTNLVRRVAVALACAGFAAVLSSCNYGDNNNDHQPPTGMGSLIIYDNTADDIHVYVDGIQTNDVKNYDNRAYDLSPAVHRVVLDQRGGDRTFSSDVDILDGRRTVMDVSISQSSGFDYDVAIFLD